MASGSATQCLSAVANLRCQGLSTGYRIGAFIPSAIETVLAPLLFAAAWYQPTAPLILLAIEILLHTALATWDLLFALGPPGPGSFAVEDSALAITSPLPLLFLHLASLSHTLALRAHLPTPFRSVRSAILYITLAAPLVPAVIFSSLLSSFLGVQYRSFRDHVTASFPDGQGVHTTLAFVGAGAAAGFLLITAILGSVVVLSSQARLQWAERTGRGVAPWIVVVLGWMLAAAELLLTFAPSFYGVILTRQLLRLVSHTVLAIGLVWVSRSSPSASALESAGVGPGPGPKSHRPPPLEFARDARSAARRSLRRAIGDPVAGTFRVLDSGGTKAFVALNSAETGMSSGNGTGSAIPAERVVFRMPARRAPMLSFTGSTFDSLALDRLRLNPNPGVRASETTPAPAPRADTNVAPVPSAFALSSRKLVGRAGQGQGPSPGAEASIKKNVGSIYAPRRVTVDEADLHPWPPQPPAPAHVPLEWDPDTNPHSGAHSRVVEAHTSLTDSLAISPYPAAPFPLPPSTLPPGLAARDRRSVLGGTPLAPSPTLFPRPRQRLHHPYNFTADPPSSRPVSTSQSDHGIDSGPLRVGEVPVFRTGDVTVSNALPRVPSVRRKPIPTIDEPNPDPYPPESAGPSPSPYPSPSTHRYGVGLGLGLRPQHARQNSLPRSIRPEIGRRRETDPAMAIDPTSISLRRSASGRDRHRSDIPASVSVSGSVSRSVSGSGPGPGSGNRPLSSYAQAQRGSRRSTSTNPNVFSPSSSYSSGDGRLFFSTPMNSPESSASPTKSTRTASFARGGSTVVPPSVMDELPVPQSAADASGVTATGIQDQRRDPDPGKNAGRERAREQEREREADVETLLVSLGRLRRATGLELDSRRLDSPGPSTGGIGGSSEGRYSMSTISEDNTPLASGVPWDKTGDQDRNRRKGW